MNNLNTFIHINIITKVIQIIILFLSRPELGSDVERHYTAAFRI